MSLFAEQPPVLFGGRSARIVPDGFWVADKVEVVQRVSLDPILCCNFDHWFVGLAQWA